MYTDQEFYEAQKHLPDFDECPLDFYLVPIIEPLSPVINRAIYPNPTDSLRTITFRKNHILKVWEVCYYPKSIIANPWLEIADKIKPFINNHLKNGFN